MKKRRAEPIDPDNPPLTAEDFVGMRPALEAMPAAAAAAYRRTRGPQKTPTKHLVSLRLDGAVLTAYRATGKGWQARMNQTLAEHAPRSATVRTGSRHVRRKSA